MDGRAPARTPGRPCRQRTAGRWARAGLHALRGRSGSLGPARGTGKACTYGSGDGRLGGGLLCVSAQAGLLRALAGGLGKDGGSRRPPAPHALRTRAAVGRACGLGCLAGAGSHRPALAGRRQGGSGPRAPPWSQSLRRPGAICPQRARALEEGALAVRGGPAAPPGCGRLPRASCGPGGTPPCSRAQRCRGADVAAPWPCLHPPESFPVLEKVNPRTSPKRGPLGASTPYLEGRALGRPTTAGPLWSASPDGAWSTRPRAGREGTPPRL